MTTAPSRDDAAVALATPDDDPSAPPLMTFLLKLCAKLDARQPNTKKAERLTVNDAVVSSPPVAAAAPPTAELDPMKMESSLAVATLDASLFTT